MCSHCGNSLSQLRLSSCIQGVLLYWWEPSFWSISGYLFSFAISLSEGLSATFIEVNYIVFWFSGHIRIEQANVSLHISIDGCSKCWPWMLLVIGFEFAVSGSYGGIEWWDVVWCVLRWLVSLDGTYPAHRVASVSGLIQCDYLERGSPKCFQYIVHFPVVCIISFSDWNFRCGLHWCGVSSQGIAERFTINSICSTILPQRLGYERLAVPCVLYSKLGVQGHQWSHCTEWVYRYHYPMADDVPWLRCSWRHQSLIELMWMRHVSLCSTIDIPSHFPAHTRLCQHVAPCNRWISLVFIHHNDDHNFHAVRWAELNIVTNKCLHELRNYPTSCCVSDITCWMSPIQSERQW